MWQPKEGWFSLAFVGIVSLYLAQVVNPQSWLEIGVCFFVLSACVCASWLNRLAAIARLGRRLSRMDSAEALSAGGRVGRPAVDEAMDGSSRLTRASSAAPPLPDNGSMGIATSIGAANSKRAAAMFDSASSTVEGSSEKLLSDILFIGSEAAAAAAAAMAKSTEDAESCSRSSSGPPSPVAAAAENMSSALGGCGLPDVFPALRSLIGAEEAANAFLAATAAAASTRASVPTRGVAKGVVLQYESIARSVPCSIKVSTAMW